MVDVASALRGSTQSTPQDAVKPNELVLKLMGEKPSEVLDFPRYTPDGKSLFQYRMCVLSQHELDGCLIDAERFTREQFKSKVDPNSVELGAIRGEAWEEVYNNSKIVEVLLRACRQVEPKTSPAGRLYYDPLFIGGSQIRSLLTTDELAALFAAYQNTQFRFGPLFRMLNSDQVDAIISQLEEGLDTSPLLRLEREHLIVLAVSLAERNRSLRTAIGSCGGHVEDGISEMSTKTDGNESSPIIDTKA